MPTRKCGSIQDNKQNDLQTFTPNAQRSNAKAGLRHDDHCDITFHAINFASSHLNAEEKIEF